MSPQTKILPPLFPLAVLLSATLLIPGCQKKITGQDGTPTPPGTLKGVSLSPRSYQPDDFTDFFEKARQAGRVVSWAGDWLELEDTTGGGPRVITELASTYDYIPVVELQFFEQATGQLIRPLDEVTRKSYKEAAAAFAKEYKPPYLALGIEVNVLYEKIPADFETFVPFYAQVYDTVKAVSPGTRVFTIFQLEKMKGLGGGLFGGTNDPDKAQWPLLDRFPQNDLVAFTTYPGLIYPDPADISEDYYTDITAHTSGTVAFTEMGWHSAAGPAGWESSEGEQAEFVVRFFDLTGDLDPELAIWSFLYDQDVIEPFNSMGLRRPDGTARPAWDKWVAAQ